MQVSMIKECGACKKTQKQYQKENSGNIYFIMFHVSFKKSRSNIGIINKFDLFQNRYQFKKVSD